MPDLQCVLGPGLLNRLWSMPQWADCSRCKPPNVRVVDALLLDATGYPLGSLCVAKEKAEKMQRHQRLVALVPIAIIQSAQDPP
jgi:hypothetical protein